MQKPSVGRIVLMPADCVNMPVNGAEVLPAIITRVWSDEMINVQVFIDSGPTVAKTSVKLYDTAEAAEAGQANVDRAYAQLRCYWPPRV